MHLTIMYEKKKIIISSILALWLPLWILLSTISIIIIIVDGHPLKRNNNNNNNNNGPYISTGYLDNQNNFNNDNSNDDSLLIQTTRGMIRGQRMRSLTGRLVDEFLGIPFAKPPIGDLRYKHPLPIDFWDGIFNATKQPKSCYQVEDHTFGTNFLGTNMWNVDQTNLDEDCLTLNIWVPYPRPKNSAVLVWIYGGCFNTGSTSLDLYDGKIMATEENIILVSINYRLGNLGFLYFDNTNDVVGNAGMFDQVMALQWIQANIEKFGGNRNNITLFGESAGATSIAYHLLSPLSQHLFSQGILQSGSPTVPWGLVEKKKIHQRGLMLAESVGCPYDDQQIDQVINCLRQTDPLLLMRNESGDANGVVEFAFTPIVDGVFLTDYPEKLMNDKRFKKTRILLGSNTEEATYFIIYKLTEKFKLEEDIYLTRADFNNSVKLLYPNISPIGQSAIIYEYTDWLNPDDPIKNRDAIDKIVGDYYFVCHVNKFADRYASVGNEVYMYYFAHRSTKNPWPKWMGTMHGDEIPFIFGEPFNETIGYTHEEFQLSKQMMNCWANFAKTGNPTMDENGIWSQLHWPLYTAYRKEYLTFSTNYSIGQGIRTKQCAFWQTYLPQLIDNITSLEKKNQLCHNSANKSTFQQQYFPLLNISINIISMLFVIIINNNNNV
ncbi:acetylcholinesterase-like isoform X1 [Dermatophagoides pteronyssinus]|uniref:acetylcholinesterase-like isoform X1 n=1 Tax=Dermatophagoides pteronyssinus TaxID=6956 RepID=UPI003F66D417